MFTITSNTFCIRDNAPDFNFTPLITYSENKLYRVKHKTQGIQHRILATTQVCYDKLRKLCMPKSSGHLDTFLHYQANVGYTTRMI